MSASPTRLSIARRPAWSMRCSTRSRAASAPANSCPPTADAGGPKSLSFRAMAARKSTHRSQSGSAEDRLIAKHFSPLATHPGALGLGDDAAVVAVPPGHDLVVTTDGVIEGVHFFPDDPPELVAKKALRINLSDLAGKGAEPLGFLLSVALTRKA